MRKYSKPYAKKKVMLAGTVTLHHRYIYRGYLQIAALDLTRSAHPALWLVTWDPSQPVATRPLAIQKDGTWFTYGYDLTKNICEVFGPAGYIRTAYSYAPFGAVTASDNGVIQPFQWSSEHYDSELDLVYYNYRHYSPSLGRFLSRDPIEEQGGLNLYAFVRNALGGSADFLGTACIQISEIKELGGWKLKKIIPEIDQPYTGAGLVAIKAFVGDYAKEAEVSCCCRFLYFFKRNKTKTLISQRSVRLSLNRSSIFLANPTATNFAVPSNPGTLLGFFGSVLAETVGQKFGFYVTLTSSGAKRMEDAKEKFESGELINNKNAVWPEDPCNDE